MDSSANVSAIVTATGVPSIKGTVTLFFKDTVKLQYMGYLWDKRKIKVMLLSPNSENVIKRANDIKYDSEQYRKDIIKSLDFLRELKEEKTVLVDIEVKLYQSYPFWKYIFLVDKYVWVQQYPFKDHVINAPGYAFQRLNETPSVYTNMEEQFQRRFQSERFGAYNLIEDELKYPDRTINNFLKNYRSLTNCSS